MDSIDVGNIRDQIMQNPQVNPSAINSGNGIGIDPNLVPSTETIYYNALVFFTWAVGIIAVLIFLYAGFSYITSAGDQEKSGKARKMMLGAVIGIIIIMSSFTLYNTTIKVLGGNGSQADIQQKMNEKPSI